MNKWFQNTPPNFTNHMEFKLVSRQDDAELKRIGTLFMSVAQLVSWCFEPSQPQRITSGLNTNLTLFRSYSIHKSSYHKSYFLAYLYSAGTQHGNLHLAGWPILFCRPTQEPCVSHNQHRKYRERFWKKCRWMDRKCRNKQEKNPWQ